MIGLDTHTPIRPYNGSLFRLMNQQVPILLLLALSSFLMITMAKPTPPASISQQKIYADLISSFEVPRYKLRSIASYMSAEFVKGLHAENHSIQMIPSYVIHLPKGSELGTYLTIDLGGTNFRVCAVHLKGNSIIEVDADKFVVDENVKNGKGSELFDFLASCVKKFIDKRSDKLDASMEMELGFTFSFPIHQTCYASGTIKKWTKGFSSSDTIGKDAVQLLQTALLKLGLKIKVVALVNDTVGTLVAHAYKEPSTVLGVIFGTGTNAAYIEKLDQITKFMQKVSPSMDKAGMMLINTEWGGFDHERKVLPITPIDLTLDLASTNKGEQLFEKMISGLYLGEITGRSLLYLAEHGVLFNGKVTSEMHDVSMFQTSYMSMIEADISSNLAQVADILVQYTKLPWVSITDCHLVKSLVQQIGTRAARLSAVGVYSLLEKMGVPKNDQPVTVAIDGSVWCMYPMFPDRLSAALEELMGSENYALVQFQTASDGSGCGAGVLAALAPMHAI